MKALHWLTATVRDGIIVLEGAGDYEFSLLAATCSSSSEPHFFTRHHQVSLRPTFGKDALIAVCVHTVGRGSVVNHSYFIGIRWEDHKVVVDLNAHFVSPQRRIGNIHSSSEHVEMSVLSEEGQWFTCERTKDGQVPVSGPRPNHRVVEDANLLCRYLLGEADDADLEIAASADTRTALERELARLRREVDEKCSMLSKLQQDTTRLGKENVFLYARVEADRRMLDRAEATIASINAALRNEGEQRTRFGFFARSKVAKIYHIVADDIV